jgi:hypothetical protein
MSSIANLKADRERKIFALFAQKRGWPSDDRLIQSRPEPEPDILYEGPNEKIAFELVENCTQTIAYNTAKLQEGNGKDFQWVSDPSRAVMKSKLAKNYTSDHPIELLIYANGRIVTPDDVVIDTLCALLDGWSDKVPFRRVWYFGENSVGTLLWEQST